MTNAERIQALQHLVIDLQQQHRALVAELDRVVSDIMEEEDARGGATS